MRPAVLGFTIWLITCPGGELQGQGPVRIARSGTAGSPVIDSPLILPRGASESTLLLGMIFGGAAGMAVGCMIDCRGDDGLAAVPMKGALIGMPLGLVVALAQAERDPAPRYPGLGRGDSRRGFAMILGGVLGGAAGAWVGCALASCGGYVPVPALVGVLAGIPAGAAAMILVAERTER